MKAWKRILALILALLMITAALVACKDDTDGEGEEPPATDDTPKAEEKEIDVYFIAGQSNASGFSKIKDADKLYADFPALQSGTAPYIMYAGNPNGNSGDNVQNKDWGDVKLGFGGNASNMGPEVGMAKALSAYYNAESGKHAAIIKFAHGGTGLCNTEGKGSNAQGDWTPPSFGKPDEDNDSTNYIGGLYRGLVAEAYKRISELKQKGYTKINVKGLYWMQGCNDTWRYSPDPNNIAHNWYTNAFKCLVTDFRKDLTDIMQTVQGNNGGANSLPFFIGTISPTYGLDITSLGTPAEDNGALLETAKKRNDPFIAMQKTLVESNSNCYIVDNGAYRTIDYVIENEGTPQQKVKYTVVGTDYSHWSQDDCYEIGQNVGKLMLEKCTK